MQLRGLKIVSIHSHQLGRPIDINQLIFNDYYRLYRLISDDRLSLIGHAGKIVTNEIHEDNISTEHA